MRHVRFRQDHLFARRISPRSNLPHALFARFLGRRPLLVLLVRVFLRARKSKAASNTVERTVCNPFMATLPTVCHVTGISILRCARTS